MVVDKNYAYTWGSQAGRPADKSRNDSTIVADLYFGQNHNNDRVKGYAAFQDPASMNAEQVSDAINFLGQGNYGNAPQGWNWLQQLQIRQQELDATAAMTEYQNAMLEAYGQMAEASRQAAEAAAYVAPYQQPAQQANAAVQDSRADAARQQMMRRGLLSLTRFGNSSGGNNKLGVL